MQKNYQVAGMSCSGCERTVEAAALKIPGVVKAQADHKAQTLKIEFSLEPPDDEEVKRAIENAGFSLSL